MNRRSFLLNSSALGAGWLLNGSSELRASGLAKEKRDWYALFQNPDSQYRPFVRWWWNGDKVTAGEITRELHLLKEAGIGGVEINPIEFPKLADDMGIGSVRWLSDQWIDLVQHACNESISLNMTSDLIVGSGWPFGSEDLKENERAQVLLVFAEKLTGPMIYETSQFNVCQAVDPGVTVKNPLRQPKILSLHLAKDPMGSLDDAIDISDQKENENIRVDIPAGAHVFYAVVRFSSFAQVINGAPGASGSILNHLDKQAVERYLDRMSDTIQNRIGALADYIRAMFHDSMELEGCNWTHDFAEEFKKRCGYDLMPYLPFIMFKVGRLGMVVDENYGAQKSETFREILNRVRFDFEFLKATLLKERFTETYVAWCKKLRVKSRAQAYGRGFFPLESGMEYDIPEGESWTTNYLRHKLGEEMPESDYRRGRGYTMINKYVSSAAHLTGKRMVSCEEMTNTYSMFNATPEFLKLGSDQAVMSGITHSIWSGFNYSPKEAPFPGWIQYGSFYNEKCNWWPYFRLLNDYKARLSSQLLNADPYTDIAILPANYDLWTEYGVQTDPFPEKLNVPYTSLLWEAINKTGGAADYISEIVLEKAVIKSGQITFGKKAYPTLLLPGVKSIGVLSLKKIHEFVGQGGRVYCIDEIPHKSLGLMEKDLRDAEVQDWIKKIQELKNGVFKLLQKPEDDKFLEWYDELRKQEGLPQYLTIEQPNRYFMQNRYMRDDGSEFYFFQNAHRYQSHTTRLQFDRRVVKNRYAWVWDLDSGRRFRLALDEDGGFEHDFGPTESLLVVFDRHRRGEVFKPLPVTGSGIMELDRDWNLELIHGVEHTTSKRSLDTLIDLKDDPDLRNFTGTVVYTKEVNVNTVRNTILNLGNVQGVSELRVNKQLVGIKWYGRRVFDITNRLKPGANEVEVRVVTTMGNYMKTLKDNKVAQYWVNRPGREQEIQSMGLIGPVRLYEV
ncbi:MAG: glycoside hydrolase family 2 [Chitinophagaceae bacterium]|nr:glycoside hydrolase family 2 [Chitinophagaceae bacterium]